MHWQQYRLTNGLRVLTIRRPSSPLVAIKVCVRAGSRHDDGAFGAAHLLEHWLMSGTQHRSALEIHDALDALGGDMNAQAGKDYTGFHVVVPTTHWLSGLDVLSDVLHYPLLDSEALAREKLIVLEEIRQSRGQNRIIFSFFAQTLWQKHPLRHPILGYPETVLSLDDEALVQLYRRRFTTGNVTIAVCGDLDHDMVCDQVGYKLADLPGGDEIPTPPVVEPPLTKNRFAHLTRETNQAYLMLGVPTVSIKHPDRSALKVIERILGMGMGARLYRRLRDELRLVYSVSTATAHYEDTGYLAVSTTCHPHNVASVREVILEEWTALGQHGVSRDELNKAQANYAGMLLRRFETNLSIASIAAMEGLLHQVEPFPESIARIQAVTADDVQRVAERYLNTQAYVMVTAGPETMSSTNDIR